MIVYLSQEELDVFVIGELESLLGIDGKGGEHGVHTVLSAYGGTDSAVYAELSQSDALAL